ncbi:MAG: hypothetical protein ACKVRP_08180 [Bacteroidota bacterium]
MLKQMIIQTTYRNIAIGLTVMFALFNIGLPIVIASCPMTLRDGSAACFGCFEESIPGTHQISYQKDTSCCATIIAVERDKAEFLHVEKLQCATHDVTLTIIPLAVVSSPISNTALFSYQFHFPPHSLFAEDIPIFCSSLLI